MKRYFNWILIVSLTLVLASAITYSIHYLIFRDLHHIFIYMVGDIAFVFLDVLLVILFIERILARREKKAIFKKLNMVIGTFFSEVGLKLLSRFSKFVENCAELEKKLCIKPEWGNKDFAAAMDASKNFKYQIDFDVNELVELRKFLSGEHPFMLRLLENSTLLEHEIFTDLMWAISHLTEELQFRGEKIYDLPETDISHLKNDIRRAFSQLVLVWIAYNQHLKDSYPFLFSLYSRINPMNPDASPIVT
ncbi:MAG: hypothetical protein JW755_05370 [Candidatus Aminicenantes bacterium]|nr:hypothetical protein [Candidatus Aminicenantes bacterium]